MFSSKVVIFLFVCLTTCLALTCKNCNVDCVAPLDEECLEPGEDQEVACLVETFKDNNNTTLYQRKCVLYEKDTKYQCIDYPNYETLSCVTCKSDRCNGVKKVNGTESLTPKNKN